MRQSRFGDGARRYKMKRIGIPAGICITLLVVLALLFSQQTAQTSPLWAQETSADSSAAEQLSKAFVEVAEEVKPAVVYIQVETKAQVSTTPDMEEFFRDWPFPWRFEVPERQREYRRQGVGSGVIVEVQGDTAYILTNYHVVNNTENIKVIVGIEETEKREYEGKTRGLDQNTELALVEIKGEGPFPVARLGDSDELEVGEWVLAIGNPFGYLLSHTVSAGIVSAKGRRVGIVKGPFAYEDFIQTDAAINRGNSGGPLVNLRGEVIGINSAIASGIGEFAGVGFAIPINTAKEIMHGLIEGRVVRGYLGIAFGSLTAELREHFDAENGVLVTQVFRDSPAEDVLNPGDVITHYRGRAVVDSERFRRWVAQTQVGEKVKIKVIRDGEEKTLEVTIAEQPGERPVASLPGTTDALGISVQELTPELARQLGYEGERGVLVSAVSEDSRARGRIRPGDLIKWVNQKPVSSVAEFMREISKVKPEESILFYIRRGSNYSFVPVPGKEQ
jgi:serine protease Do